MNAYRREFLYSFIREIALEKYPKDKNLSKRIDKCFVKLIKEYYGIKMYKWKDNSCFIDSVLAIILYSKYNYWRKLIDRKPGVLTELIKSDSKYCIDLRKELKKMDKTISMAGSGEAVGIYVMLAEYYGFKTGSLDPYIVYPTETPSSDVVVYSPLMHNSDGKVVHHFPNLDEYEKIGILVNTGGHYVAYFKTYDGIYYYNDLQDAPRRIKAFPDSPSEGHYFELVFYVKKTRAIRYL